MQLKLSSLYAPLNDLLSYRSRPQLFALLMYQGIITTGFTLLMPLVAAHFVNDIGMTAAIVGLALALRQMCQQGLTFIGGMLADRHGLKPVLCTGLIIRTGGFFLLGYAETHGLFFLALLMTGIGGALFDAPFQAATIAMTRNDERRQFYLIASYLASLANFLGPLLGLIMLQISFQAVSITACVCFIINIFVAIRYFPSRTESSTNSSDTTPSSSSANFRHILHDRRFLYFILILCGYWFVGLQINISFALIAVELLGSKSGVSIFYTFSAMLIFLAQYFLVRRLQRHFKTHQLLIIGTLVMTLGTGMVGSASNFAIFLFWIAVYTFGYLVSRPMIEILVAHLANPKALGLYSGFASFGIGLGGGLGNFMGGWLYDFGVQHDMRYFAWLVFTAIGLITVAGIVHYFRRYPEAITQ